MSGLSLALGVRHPSDAKLASPIKGNPATEKARILARDHNTCRCCGFQSTQFQRVVPVEGELVTLCFFCEQSLNLDVAGMSGAGLLIWLPEISQADLNHLARAIYVARRSEGKLATAATRALDALMARRADVKKRLGSDDPLLLATVFHEALSSDEYKARKKKLEGVRLLPLDKRVVMTRQGSADIFPRILDFWCSPEGPFAEIPVEKWESLFGSVPEEKPAEG